MNNNRENGNRELDRALQLHEQFGPLVPDVAPLLVLIENYGALIKSTDALMRELGVVAACTQCAVSGKGSCCFDGMDRSYGATALLVNLLLGSELHEETDFPRTCRYVGEEGCRLKARHSFCLNYFCPDLQESLGAEKIERIRRGVGEQLLAGWELERALVGWISNEQRKTGAAVSGVQRGRDEVRGP